MAAAPVATGDRSPRPVAGRFRRPSSEYPVFRIYARVGPSSGPSGQPLDHCAVAEGVLDGYRVVGGSSLFGWDYLGGMLLCIEAGAAVGEYFGNDLIVLDDSRRWPVAAATPELLAELLAAKV